MRAAVLEATGALLSHRGYDDMTVAAIAERSGAGKQSLYRIWGSKAGLAAEAVLHGTFSLKVEPVPNTGHIRQDLTAWLTGVARYVGQPRIASVVRALAAASAGDGTRAGAFDEVLTSPVRRVLIDRLEAARHAENLVVAGPLPIMADLIIGYLALSAVGTAPMDERSVADLVSVLLQS
ncbi:TetR/AcrR family transcriptional regulator [Brevibacterium oceani]|uniref:TetR/AcrR family transcriptional regulator n=1 Tax=Brevibacterium oceani TaxID=358099 RepID=UPI001B331206|nr:TetR/AcrR family transcriptional regulator [Brevibacterium oceani]